MTKNKGLGLIPICILLIAFALRQLFLMELLATVPGSPYSPPFCGVDSVTHNQRALGLLAGQYPGNKPWLFIPFYPLFLATTYRLTSINLYLPLIIQSLLNLLTCAALYSIGHRLFSRRVGALASLALAIYAPLSITLLVLTNRC